MISLATSDGQSFTPMGVVRTVPEESQGRQPVPGPEKMQNTLAWQWALKIAKPSSTRLENFKKISKLH